MQVADDRHVSHQLRPRHYLNKVLIRVDRRRLPIRVNLVEGFPRWLYDWLRNRLVVLLFNHGLHVLSEDSCSLWIILLVLMKHNLHLCILLILRAVIVSLLAVPLPIAFPLLHLDLVFDIVFRL